MYRKLDTTSKRGFTLIEMIVVVGMLMLLAGSVTSSVVQAQKRAKISKAMAEARELTNAILAYENISRNHELPTLSDVDAEDSANSIGFVLGNGGVTQSGETAPVLYNGAVSSGKVLDPWGTPYHVRIEQRTIAANNRMSSLTMYVPMPNFWGLTLSERGIVEGEPEELE